MTTRTNDMGNLVVFLRTRETTGAVCNPGKTADEAMDLIFKTPVSDYPITIKRENVGDVGVTVDCQFLQQASTESLRNLLRALEALTPIAEPTGSTSELSDGLELARVMRSAERIMRDANRRNRVFEAAKMHGDRAQMLSEFIDTLVAMRSNVGVEPVTPATEE